MMLPRMDDDDNHDDDEEMEIVEEAEQLVPVDFEPLDDNISKQIVIPKAVEKVLSGAIRRKMALEEFCTRQNAEIMQLNRLVQQYKHERECNLIIGQLQEDKIARLENLMEGVPLAEEFVDEDLTSLANQHVPTIVLASRLPDLSGMVLHSPHVASGQTNLLV
ncbi:hypothetical protein M8C21_005248 [Ambrosia artemisiifolia]|uniref:Uncharacterized protein n=1 Tax=Ambrosia artemisiifolia TaxID=4212 RepID=A0AAD5BZU5_AMBAR|nr:hypothetical protein M8C21_005248 [Ambrosia artemisiifolia]